MTMTMRGLAAAASALPATTPTYPSLQLHLSNVQITPFLLNSSSSSSSSSCSLAIHSPHHRKPIICRSNSRPPGPPASGENESRNVLDAFFLGKALAEAVNERIESTIGEFLSAIGRLQAEQQKQVLDFQEEVLERAKRAKEKAAREAMEEQGLIPKSTIVSATSVTNGAASKASLSATNGNDRTSANSSSYDPVTPAANKDLNSAEQE